MEIIRVEDVWKEYLLGVIGHGRLTHDLQAWWAKLRGKPDPNSKIAVYDQAQKKQVDGDRFLALQGIDLQVQEGDVLGVIGRNGAGKSTFLKILSRITAPSRGQVRIRGRIASLLEVGTGFHAELTGRENIFLNGAILGMSRPEIKRKLDEIIDFSGVEQHIDTPVKRYSSGMYVRLAFAVAAHLEPEILLVDEVLAVGDQEFQKKCLGKMKDVSRDGRTVLFVSHNMGSISQLCTRCLWLDAGKVKEIGKTEKVVAHYINGTNAKLSGETKFPEDETKAAQLRQIRLINECGEITRNFNCDEPVRFELFFEVRQKLPGLYGYMGINLPDGTQILVSDSLDMNPNPLDHLEIGVHKVVVTLPNRTLGPGEYHVHLAFTSMAADNIHVDVPGTVASFVLDDYTSVYGNKRPGFFSTQLLWDVESCVA